MIEELRYTLLADGSSDRALLPLLTWLMRCHLPNCAIQPQWSDLRRLRKELRDEFPKRIRQSLELYPCELLFIHRDAEKEPRQNRVDEIFRAIKDIDALKPIPLVCVIPVHMTEAWLLFDIKALRKAASNPNGKISLQLPDLKRLENEPDPKAVLYELLRQASELSSRRLRNFAESERVYRLAELIDDFSPLRTLPAFAELESEVREVITANRWQSLEQ